MSRRCTSSLAALALLAILAPRSDGQGTPAHPPAGASGPTTAASVPRYRFRLLGVYDRESGEPLQDVAVTDVLNGTSANTTATGTVSLQFLPDGGSLVRIRKLGYEAQTMFVAISPADTAPITLILQKATQLPTVVVNATAPTYHSPRLQEAEKRILTGVGYSINEAEMRKNDNSTLANTIRSRLPRLMSVTGPHGETYFVSTRKVCRQGFGCRTPNCYVSVFIDGVQSTILPDFDRLSTQDYAIAEYFPGGAEVPPEYGGMQSPCGALLLWTREQ